MNMGIKEEMVANRAIGTLRVMLSIRSESVCKVKDIALEGR
jgi:hypothetical protein